MDPEVQEVENASEGLLKVFRCVSPWGNSSLINDVSLDEQFKIWQDEYAEKGKRVEVLNAHVAAAGGDNRTVETMTVVYRLHDLR